MTTLNVRTNPFCPGSVKPQKSVSSITVFLPQNDVYYPTRLRTVSSISFRNTYFFYFCPSFVTLRFHWSGEKSNMFILILFRYTYYCIGRTGHGRRTLPERLYVETKLRGGGRGKKRYGRTEKKIARWPVVAKQRDVEFAPSFRSGWQRFKMWVTGRARACGKRASLCIIYVLPHV